MFERLCRVPTIIERDALIQELLAADIDVVSPDRDVMVNLAQEPNFYLGSASLHFEGYDIRVRSEQLDKAREIYIHFRRRHEIGLMEETSSVEPERMDDAGRRFLACTLWSLAIPVVFNAVALYWFFSSKDILSQRPLLTAAALALNAAILILAAVLFLG